MDTSFKQQALGDEIIVVFPGNALDNSNAHEMVNAILDLQRRGYKYVILDMQDLAFLSSAGVGSILGTVETFREIGGDIVLCNIADPIRHVLAVLDLEEYLTIRESREEAGAYCGMEAGNV